MSRHPEPWVTLREAIEGGNAGAVMHVLASLTPADTALAVSRLDEDMRDRVISMLTPDQAADILRDLSNEQAADTIETIPASTAAAIVDRLPVDEQADILADLGPDHTRAILNAMPAVDAVRARALLRYHADQAGGLMTSEFFSYRANATIGEVIADLESNRERYAEYQIQYLYVTDADGHLVGVVRMRDLLLVPRERQVAEVMIPHPLSVNDRAPLQDLINVFEDEVFMGIPVVDSHGLLLGVVERTAVHEASTRQVRNSFLRMSGIIGGEEMRSSPLAHRTMRRFAWLGPNILLNILAASIIALYQDTLQSVIALAVFLPIVSDMSGCSGNQAVAVSIRELSLGLIKANEFGRVMAKEVWVGLTNGILLGTVLGAAAYVWKANPYLSLVVAIALAANTVVSVIIGGFMPLFAKRVRIDPALASGPILTTVTDMCGFFLVLSIAQSFLEHL